MRSRLIDAVLVALLFVTPCESAGQTLSASDQRAFQNGIEALERGDNAAALTFLLPFARAGYALAQGAVGSVYGNGGGGVTRDYGEAVTWHRRASEQGLVTSQYDVGILYVKGQGVTQDYREGMKWLRLAAIGGNARAQYSVGLSHLEGGSDRPDDAEAVRWLRMAAEKGHGDAQYNLGVMYALGAGVPKDNVEAFMWLLVSRAAVSQADSVLARLRKQMAAAEVVKAQSAAALWQRRHQLPRRYPVIRIQPLGKNQGVNRRARRSLPG